MKMKRQMKKVPIKSIKKLFRIKISDDTACSVHQGFVSAFAVDADRRNFIVFAMKGSIYQTIVHACSLTLVCDHLAMHTIAAYHLMKICFGFAFAAQTFLITGNMLQ